MFQMQRLMGGYFVIDGLALGLGVSVDNSSALVSSTISSFNLTSSRLLKIVSFNARNSDHNLCSIFAPAKPISFHWVCSVFKTSIASKTFSYKSLMKKMVLF